LGESRFRSALKTIEGAAGGGQTHRAQRDEMLQSGLGVTGSQCQLHPRCQPAQSWATIAVLDPGLHADPHIVGEIGADLPPQALACGSYPERISFSASSHSISAPSQ
jgi:hypothetical protein